MRKDLISSIKITEKIYYLYPQKIRTFSGILPQAEDKG